MKRVRTFVVWLLMLIAWIGSASCMSTKKYVQKQHYESVNRVKPAKMEGHAVLFYWGGFIVMMLLIPHEP